MPGVPVGRLAPLAVVPTQLAMPGAAGLIGARVRDRDRAALREHLALGEPGERDRRGLSVSIRNVFEPTADMLPLKSWAIHFSVPLCAIEIGSGSARARFGFHSVDAVVGVEPSVV